jgi:hypothetical protein
MAYELIHGPNKSMGELAKAIAILAEQLPRLEEELVLLLQQRDLAQGQQKMVAVKISFQTETAGSKLRELPVLLDLTTLIEAKKGELLEVAHKLSNAEDDLERACQRLMQYGRQEFDLNMEPAAMPAAVPTEAVAPATPSARREQEAGQPAAMVGPGRAPGAVDVREIAAQQRGMSPDDSLSFRTEPRAFGRQ